MLARLSNINENVGTLEHEIPDIVENSESRIPLDVIENPSYSNDIMFDNLVTNNEPEINTRARPEHLNDNNSSIYNEFGQLDIL